MCCRLGGKCPGVQKSGGEECPSPIVIQPNSKNYYYSMCSKCLLPAQTQAIDVRHPPDEVYYVIVGGRVTLARSSDQTLHFTSKT